MIKMTSDSMIAGAREPLTTRLDGRCRGTPMNENVRASGRASALAARLRNISIVACLVLPVIVHAAPPPSGGVPTGTVYYETSGSNSPANSMKPDGSAKTVLNVLSGAPSYQLHGGKRWFLRRMDVAGDPYYFGPVRRDLFALREDGALAVRLTDDPGLEYTNLEQPNMTWAPDEDASRATVSALGRRHYADGSIVAGSGGLYTATLRFDGAGNVLGLDAPLALLVSIGLNGNPANEMPDADTYTWSPGMTEVVADHRNSSPSAPASPGELRIVNVTTGLARSLLNDTSRVLSYPAWSRDGSRIAFVSNAVSEDRVESIAVNGTGRKTLVRTTSAYEGYGAPWWSPDSAYLVYEFFWRKPSDALYQADVYRITAAGAGKTNLTADIPWASPVGWR